MDIAKRQNYTEQKKQIQKNISCGFYIYLYIYIHGFPGSSAVIQEVQEIWVQSLGWEDPLEEEMATHSSILPWKIPWTEEPGRL